MYAPWIRGGWVEDVVHAADEGCRVAREVSLSPWRPWLKRRWLRHEHEGRCSHPAPELLRLVTSGGSLL